MRGADTDPILALPARNLTPCGWNKISLSSPAGIVIFTPGFKLPSGNKLDEAAPHTLPIENRRKII
jgi:hypothetical protein